MLKCTACPKRFFQASVRDAHMKRFHQQVKQDFSVPVCQSSQVEEQVDCKPDFPKMENDCSFEVPAVPAFEFVSEAVNVKVEPGDLLPEQLSQKREEDTSVNFVSVKEEQDFDEDLSGSTSTMQNESDFIDEFSEASAVPSNEFKNTQSMSWEAASIYRLECPLCKKSILFRHLYRHLSICPSKESTKWPWTCECEKKFFNGRELYSHWAKEHAVPLEDWPWVCRVCQQAMVSQPAMDEHMRVRHTEVEKVVCSHCNAEIARHSLYKHSLKHINDEMKFPCSVEGCGKTFSCIPRLRGHQKLVHSRKRYRCSLCDKDYLSYKGLRKHLAHVHCEKK